VVMMTESLSTALQARAKQMGISSLVFKPGLSKLDPAQFEADLKAFANKLLADVLPNMGRVAPLKGGPKPKRSEFSPPPAAFDEVSRQFLLLQGRLEELRGPADPTELSVLVMKVAREFFERGILFLVKNEQVRGLGGFGAAPRDESLNLLVRELLIPLSEPSVFRDVIAKRKLFAGPVPDGKWGQHLMGKIGRFKSKEIALLPLLNHRETIAILFGDNPETGREFPRLEPLEVFVNQAGIVLENAFLQRKLQALQKAL